MVYWNRGIVGSQCLWRTAARVAWLGVALASLMTACVVYQPTPTQPSVYDRAWDSALRAAQDSGIVVTFTDRGAGVIRGSKDGIDATIMVRGQADGTTRVESRSRASSIATRRSHGASTPPTNAIWGDSCLAQKFAT